MSILTRITTGALVCALATPVFALGPQTPPQASSAPLGVLVAQSSPTVLTDSDIRRINHYSAQTLDALQALGTSDTAIATLRQKVQRLVDAGERSGMNLLHTADYFEAFLAENAANPLPGAVLDAQGQFDARSLFTSVQMFNVSAEQPLVDVAAIDEADLAAIGSVAQQRAPQAPVQQTLQLSIVVQPVDVVETPVIAPNAPANVRAILERVWLDGDTWMINVERGDSLGQYANALYGDTLFFQRIFDANQNVLSTPNSITVGQALVLPKG